MTRLIAVFLVLALASSARAQAAAERRGKVLDRPLKVLMIGNSFSESVMRETPKLAKSAGLGLDIVQCGIGGCPLDKHWANVEKSGNAEFKPYTVMESLASFSGPGRKFPAKANVADMLAADRWDVVSIQQASGKSAFFDTYEPFAGKLIAKIRELAPQAEIVVQETWSYAPYDSRLAHWKMSPKDMYESLRKAYAQLASKYGLRTIPTGDAVQLFRSRLPVDYGKLLTGDEIAALKKPSTIDFHGDVVGASWWRDSLKNDFPHLNSRGHYLQACVWVGFLFGVDPATLAYRPDRLPPDDARLMRECARDALRAQ